MHPQNVYYIVKCAVLWQFVRCLDWGDSGPYKYRRPLWQLQIQWYQRPADKATACACGLWPCQLGGSRLPLPLEGGKLRKPFPRAERRRLKSGRILKLHPAVITDCVMLTAELATPIAVIGRDPLEFIYEW